MIEQVFIELLFAHNIPLPHDFKDRVEVEEKFKLLISESTSSLTEKLQRHISILRSELIFSEGRIAELEDELEEMQNI